MAVIGGSGVKTRIELTPEQGQIFLHPARWKCVIAGRRFGKSYLAVTWLLSAALSAKDLLCYYVAPTYRQAKEIAWITLKRLLPMSHVTAVNESELSIVFRNESRVKLKGAETYDSLRGVGIDRLVMDEFADIAEEAWTEVLRPAMADRQGHALFIGTPKGYNWAKKLYDHARSDPAWATWHYTTEEGGWVKPEELEAIRTQIGAAMFRQEHLAEFVDLSNNIFRREWWRYYQETPVTYGCIQSWDTAFKKGAEADYSVCTTWGLTKNAYVLLDLWRGQVEFPELRRQVQALYAKHKPYAVIVEDKASGQSLIQELQRETAMPIFPTKVDSDKITRANAVTPMIESGRVLLPSKAPWLADFLEEMTAFPSGEHDDIVDSVAHALNYLRNSAIGPPEERVLKTLADIMIDAIERPPEPTFTDLVREQFESDAFWEGEYHAREMIYDIR